MPFAGLAVGATIAIASAVCELMVRSALGGTDWAIPADRLTLVIGAYALAGAAAGLVASQIWAVFGRARGRFRIGLGTLTAAVGAVAGIGLRRAVDLPVGPRSIAVAAAILGALVAIFGSVVGAGRLARALTRGAVLAPVAAVATISVAWAAPHLLLGESPLGVSAGWRLVAGLLAGASGSLTLLAYLAWHCAPDGRAPRLGRWSAASLGVLLLVPLGLLAIPGLGGAPADRPNVLLIVIDTLRADRLSTYGYGRSTSPHIDRLGASGVVFEQVATPASATQPAVASLFTGRYPFEHGVRLHPAMLRPVEETLGETLRARGYATGAIVSNPILSAELGYDQGFEFYDAAPATSKLRRRPAGVETLALFRLLHPLGRSAGAGETAEAAVRWLRRHRDRPFFLWVHFIDPHFPYDPPAPYDRQFSSGPTDAYRKLVRAYTRGEISKGDLAVRERHSPQLLAEASDLYDGEIAYTDRSIGDLLDAVRRLGLAEETLVVLTADHGESLGEHGVSFAHVFTVYEQVMHVPLIIAGWPGIQGGSRIAEQVSLVDIAPTVLNLLEIPAPAGMRGRSLAPLLLPGRHESGVADVVAYGENMPLLPGHPSAKGLMDSFDQIYVPGIEGKWRMIRSAPWKLIHVPGRPEGEDLLFRLDQDPEEKLDRSAMEPEVLARLKSQLAAMIASDPGSAGLVQQGPLDPETEEMLRSLGYIN